MHACVCVCLCVCSVFNVMNEVTEHAQPCLYHNNYGPQFAITVTPQRALFLYLQNVVLLNISRARKTHNTAAFNNYINIHTYGSIAISNR